jgi:integrase
MADKAVKLDPFLQRRGKGLYAVVTIPPSLRDSFEGKRKLVRGLGTQSVSEAHKNNYLEVVAELKDQIKTKREAKARGTGFTFSNQLITTAVTFQKQIDRAENRGDFTKAAEISIDLAIASDDVEAKFGSIAGRTMWMVGNGSPSINQHLETWLAEKHFAERTKADHRTSVGKLVKWLEGIDLVPTISQVTSKVAANFKFSELLAKKVNPKTANKLLSGVRTYWKWLMDHGLAEDNPWTGKSLPKQHLPKDELERPFTDNEVIALYAGNADQRMRDVMTIAALSGMREEEIYQLTVADCEDGCFDIKKSKTNAGVRKTPIHSELAIIMERRLKNKQPKDFLIEEGKATGWGGARAMSFSKRFATYRRRCGVDEVPDGKRRSLVNFHSWRRWFITKADQAGLRREDIERVVGHKVQGMSLGLYSGGASLDQLKAVVASVKLPNGVSLTAKPNE